jgi:hypothetical protein
MLLAMVLSVDLMRDSYNGFKFGAACSSARASNLRTLAVEFEVLAITRCGGEPRRVDT